MRFFSYLGLWEYEINKNISKIKITIILLKYYILKYLNYTIEIDLTLYGRFTCIKL